MFANTFSRWLTAFAVCAVFALVLAAPAGAQMYQGTRPMAMGGAYSAVANDLNAMQWNPAGLAFLLKRKQIGFNFNYERQENMYGDAPYLYVDLKEDDESPDPDDLKKKKAIQDWYHLGVVDGYINPYVSVGLGFTGLGFPNAQFKEGRDYWVDLSLAGGMADIFSLGGTFRYIDVAPDVTEVKPGKFDMDVGALFHAVNIVSIGLVGRHLFGSDNPVWVRREIALGVAGWVLEYAVLSVEVTKVFDGTKRLGDYDAYNKSGIDFKIPGTFNFAFGVEGIVAKMVALRGGYNYDQVGDSQTYAIGAAFIDKNGTLGYTFRGNVKEVRDFAHSVELALFFP
jgi:hypothetical protein